jgi:hypothetical protein
VLLIILAYWKQVEEGKHHQKKLSPLVTCPVGSLIVHIYISAFWSSSNTVMWSVADVVKYNSNTGFIVVVLKIPKRIKFFLFSIYAAIRSSFIWDVTQSKSSWPAWPLKTGLIGRPETSVSSYQSLLCNIPEEWRSHLHSDRSLKSRSCSHNFRHLNLMYEIVL